MVVNERPSLTHVEWTRHWREVILEHTGNILRQGGTNFTLALPQEGFRFLYRMMGGQEDI